MQQSKQGLEIEQTRGRYELDYSALTFYSFYLFAGAVPLCKTQHRYVILSLSLGESTL
jgi:hypothetical protein